MPTTSVAKISGTISDLIMRREICDNGSSLTANAGKAIPMMIPTIAAMTIHCVSETRRRPRRAVALFSVPALSMAVHPAVTQRRVAIAVSEVEYEAHSEPDDKANPGDTRQLRHEIEARHDGDQRRERNPRHAERPRPVRIGSAKHDHARGHQHERKQRPDIREIDHFGDVGECGKDRYEDPRYDRADVRSLVTWMNFREHRRKQSVARHREEDSWLPELKDKQHAAHRYHGTQCDDEAGCIEKRRRSCGVPERGDHRLRGSQLLPWRHASHHHRDRDVEQRRHNKTHDDPE